MADLRRATEAGFRDLALLRRDERIQPLRERPDFQMLLQDLALPADPFARGH